jgi:NAD(P)-dependent dehydrogenase (short-subunit alcohol dehydrogenase family)
VRVRGSVALVTGASRGLGKHFVDALLRSGARKVYAGVRDIGSVTPRDGVSVIRLDITSTDDVAAAAHDCSDTTLLINNAGISLSTKALDPGAVNACGREFATNVFGTLAVCNAFAPVLAANGGGALVNVLSVSSWIAIPDVATYGASKAALWSLTNSLRLELLEQGTQVLAVHCGVLDTDMSADLPVPKIAPADVVDQAVAALELGQLEVLTDRWTRRVRRGLSEGLADLYPPFRQVATEAPTH